MFEKLFAKLGNEWALCREETRMALCGGFVKEERDLQALKNLVHVARERVWLANEPKQRDYSTTFSEVMEDREKTIIMESAKVVEELLKREIELRNRHVK